MAYRWHNRSHEGFRIGNVDGLEEMRIGLHLSSAHLQRGSATVPDAEAWWRGFRYRCKMAEEAGFSVLFISENQFSQPDTLIQVAVALETTRKIVVAPGCTNVVFRHPSIIGSALSTLMELGGGGRTLCVLGSGDTPVRQLGFRPTSVALLRDAIGMIRSGQYPAEGGRPDVPLRWSGLKVPVYVAADGPRMLAMGAGCADGIISGNGVSDGDLRWLQDIVRKEEEVRHRSGISTRLDVWNACFVHLGTQGEIPATLRRRMSNRIRHSSMAAPELVQTANEELTARLLAGFNISQYWSLENAKLVPDELLDRWGIFGEAPAVCERLHELELLGVDSLMIDVDPVQTEEMIAQIGERIIPAVGTTC